MNDRKEELTGARELLRSADFRDRIQQQIDGIMAAQGELKALIVSTIDGRAFAHAGRDALDPQRLAALGSTLLSICYTLGRELRAGGVNYASLMLDQAVIVSRRIPDRSRVFTLSLIGNDKLNMALALRCSSDACIALAHIIDEQLSRAAAGPTRTSTTETQ